MRKKEIKKEFDNEVLSISRVERMTAGGRRLRFRTLVVVGNRKGKVGIGLAKGKDVQQAIEKAVKKAEKNIVVVPIKRGGTIPYEVKAKFGAAVILLKPQTEGRGLVAGGTVRTICALVGIDNISGKILGNTRNKINNAKATIKALQKLKITEKKEEKDESKEEEKMPKSDTKAVLPKEKKGSKELNTKKDKSSKEDKKETRKEEK